MKRVLIIGGAGYLGSALLKRLAIDFQCVCFGHGSRYPQLRERLNGNTEFIEGDITDGNALRSALCGVDAVIHVAGTGGEADCLANPVKSVLTHIFGTHVLLREVLRANVERLIFASTIAAYGTYGSHPMPLTEDADLQPDDFYGALKATAEREIIDSERFQVLRLANVYGYGSGLVPSSGGVIDRFVAAVVAEQNPQIYGEGTQAIDHVHIDDVCAAFAIALDTPARNFVYNIGGGALTAIRELAQIVVRLAKSDVGIEVDIDYVPAPASKLWPDRWLSIAKADQELGWKPNVSLEVGILELLVNRLRENRHKIGEHSHD